MLLDSTGRVAQAYGDDQGQGPLREIEYKNPAMSFSAGMLASTKNSFIDQKKNPVLHQFMRSYHDRYNGLLFMSAGNKTQFAPSPRCSYVIVVTAVGKGFKIADFSNWGSPVWFGAPGVGIGCSDKNGRYCSVNGTSLAAPLLAGITAMFWAKAPNLPNTTIERLIDSCAGRNIMGGNWNTELGFGVPSAAKCLKNLARYNRGIEDSEEVDDTIRKAPLYTGPAFEIDPVVPSTTAEDDAKISAPFIKTPETKPTFGGSR